MRYFAILFAYIGRGLANRPSTNAESDVGSVTEFTANNHTLPDFWVPGVFGMPRTETIDLRTGSLPFERKIHIQGRTVEQDTRTRRLTNITANTDLLLLSAEDSIRLPARTMESHQVSVGYRGIVLPSELNGRAHQIVFLTHRPGEEIDSYNEYTDYHEDKGFIGISPSSRFISRFPSLVISPSTFGTEPVAHFRMDLNPPNASSRCVHGPMTYVNTIETDKWTVVMIPTVAPYYGIGDETGTDAINDVVGAYFHALPIIGDVQMRHAATISTGSNYERLPNDSVIVPLIDAVHATGAGLHVPGSGENDSNLEFSYCYSLDGFPNIVYSFYRSEGIGGIGEHALDIVLFPSDYAVVIPQEGRCVTHIRSRLESAYFTSIIGANLLHAIAVHLDATLGGRVGFCDPL